MQRTRWSSAISKRYMLTALALALSATACAGAGEAAGPDTNQPDDTDTAASTAESTDGEDSFEGQDLSVALAWLPNTEMAGFWIADHEGYYADEGLEVEFLPGGPNAPAPQVSLASGEAQLALENNPTRLADALADGQDLVLLGAVFQRSPVGMISMPERPVREVDDLHGARILADEGTRETVAAMMALLEVDDYDFIPAGGGVEPLLAGEGDVLWAFETNQVITLERQFDLTRDEDFFFVSNHDLGRETYANMIIAEREFVEQNEEAVIRFLKATLAGWERAQENPELGAELAVEIYGAELGLDPEIEQQKARMQLDYMESEQVSEHGLLWVDKDAIDGPIFDAIRAAGRDNLPNAADFVDTSYLEQARSR